MDAFSQFLDTKKPNFDRDFIGIPWNEDMGLQENKILTYSFNKGGDTIFIKDKKAEDLPLLLKEYLNKNYSNYFRI